MATMPPQATNCFLLNFIGRYAHEIAVPWPGVLTIASPAQHVNAFTDAEQTERTRLGFGGIEALPIIPDFQQVFVAS